MKWKKYLYTLLVAASLSSAPATLVVNAASATVDTTSSKADKILTYSVPQDYKGLTVTIQVEKEGKYEAKVLNNGNTFACVQTDDKTLSCTASDIKRGTLEVQITNKDGSGSVPQVTATMKMASSTTSNSTDNISVGQDITDFKLYFIDNKLVGEWADTGVGNINAQVIDLNTSETIANVTASDENKFEVEIPTSTAQVIVNVVPSASSKVDGAAKTFTLDVPQSAQATVEFENITSTNKGVATVNTTFSDVYAVKAFCNDALVFSEDYKQPGSYTFEVPLSEEGENDIVFYVVDQSGNMYSTKKTLTLDTSGPLMTFDSNYDKITVGTTQYIISGKIEDCKDFSINGNPIAVSTDGSFSYDISLHEGANEFELLANDEAGNESTYTFTITYDENANKVNPLKVISMLAVVVGVGAYFYNKKKKAKASAEEVEEKSGIEFNDDDTVEEKSSAKSEKNLLTKLTSKEKKTSTPAKIEEKNGFNLKNIKKEHIKFACVMATIIYIFGIAMSFSPITSGSMEPTLMTGDLAVYNKFAYVARDIQRGDIVSFKLDGDRTIYSKRVIAIAGDTVEFQNGYVYVNGSKIDETAYLDASVETNCNKTFEVPAKCCFVLGDNREDSKDSRYFDNPYVSYKNVINRLMFTIPTHHIFG